MPFRSLFLICILGISASVLSSWQVSAQATKGSDDPFGSIDIDAVRKGGPAGVTPTATAEPPHLSIGYKQVKTDQQACLQNGLLALQNAGMQDAHISPGGGTVFGSSGSNHAAVECAHGIAFYVVSGPELEATASLRDRIQSAIR